MAENNGKEIVNVQLPTVINSSQWGIDMGEEDIVMPRVVLLQPTSQREGAGKFFYSLTEELFDSVECVVFNNLRGRVMFDPDLSKQQSICGSNDRIVPSSRFEKPQASKCVECRYSHRDFSSEVLIGNKPVKQFCQETQTLRCMFVDSLMPFLFVGRRTSLMPINSFLSQMQFDCAKHKKPLCQFPIKISSTLITKANQKYYVPKIERLGMVEREEFIAMMNKYATYDVDKTYEAEEKTGKAEVLNEDGVPF